jgi:CheY-like chemotaxis protein
MATVFIVEDDAMVRVLAESVIQSGGYETLTAGSLAEAKSIIESNAKLDIVFTDLTLFDGHDGGVRSVIWCCKLGRGRRCFIPAAVK